MDKKTFIEKYIESSNIYPMGILEDLDAFEQHIIDDCAKENNIDYFVDEVEKIAQEFVLKVDSGKARSKVTYGHMLRLLAMVKGIRGLSKFH